MPDVRFEMVAVRRDSRSCFGVHAMPVSCWVMLTWDARASFSSVFPRMREMNHTGGLPGKSSGEMEMFL